MSARSTLAIEIGRRRLRALHAVHQRGVLRVKRILAEPFPKEIDREDVQALGAWVGATLREAKFPRTRAIVAMAREHVGFKRLTLPTTVDDELPEMTRLALRRELPVDAARAVIDFVPVRRDESSTTVLAVAVPSDVA